MYGLNSVYFNCTFRIYTSMFTYAFPYLVFLCVMLSARTSRPNSTTESMDLVAKLVWTVYALTDRSSGKAEPKISAITKMLQ